MLAKTLSCICLLVSTPILGQTPGPDQNLFAGTFKTIEPSATASNSPTQFTSYAWEGEWFTCSRYAVAASGEKHVLWSYRAKFDGQEYPFITHPGNTVTLRRIGRFAWLQTERKNGKLIATYTHIFSEDGATITNVVTQISDNGQAISRVTVAQKQASEPKP